LKWSQIEVFSQSLTGLANLDRCQNFPTFCFWNLASSSSRIFWNL
jgi:hypothetical protein